MQSFKEKLDLVVVWYGIIMLRSDLTDKIYKSNHARFLGYEMKL